jgi:uncharacterized protein YhaN
MRIDRLELVRYGRFTDCALDFAGSGMHLVVGPNEAGKSTLRSSVGELLYGIHPQTKLDFLHAMQDLRIDALLRGSDGDALEVVRLKKAKDPLRTTDGVPLKQGALEQLLAGVDRETFRTVFALDHEELQAGGKALLEGKGDLGEALFESRSSARLTTIQERLRDQYRALYVVRGKSQPLNALIGPQGRVAQAKRERDALLLDPKRYQEVTEAADTARAELKRLGDLLHADQVELNRMHRIRQAYPALDERRRLLADRTTLLSEGTPAPPDAQGRHVELDKNRRTLADAAQNARGDLAKVEVKLAELVQRADSLGTLAGSAGEVVSGPEYVARLETLLARIAELHDTRREAEVRLETAEKTAARRTQELAKREKVLAETEAPRDPMPLKAGLKAIPDGLGARIESTGKQSKAAAAKLAAARKRYARFDLPERLDELAVPGERELEAGLKRIAEADAELAEAVRDHAEELKRGRRHRRELDGFLTQDPPPSEEDLEQVRARRQKLWSQLRGAFAEGGAPPSPELVPEYEAAVSAGDDTADRMRREAQRLAERRGLELAVRESADRVAELEVALGRAREVRELLDGEWAKLWEASGLPTPAADSAADMMRALAELRGLSEEVDQYERDLAADQKSADAHVLRLRELLAESGETAADPPQGLGLAELRARAEQRQTHLTDLAREHATAVSKVEELRGDVTEAAHDAEEKQAFASGVGRLWDELMSANGLVGTAAEVKASVEQMLKVEGERSGLRERQADLLTGLEKTAEEQRQTEDGFARLMAECGATTDEELTAAIARGTELRRIDDKVDSLLTALAGHGSSVEQLEREVAAHDVDELDARILEWESRVARLDEERGEQSSELGRLEQELRGMNGSDEAAEKAEAVEQELAAVVGHGQEYLRLYLAERLLLENIEAYRQEHQGPVLNRAQAVFAALTNGRFTQLVDDTGPDGRAVLRARRAPAGAANSAEGAEHASGAADGQLVNVEGMSEGTRDQLYLALRLATLERYADEGRAMPLLLDDVLMTFDDERAAAALRVFDELAHRFQVILLTHHAHLVEVAKTAVPAERLHVHRVG